MHSTTKLSGLCDTAKLFASRWSRLDTASTWSVRLARWVVGSAVMMLGMSESWTLSMMMLSRRDLAELEMKTTQSSGPMSCARMEAASVVAGETAFAPTCDNLVATIWANESEAPTPVRWRMKSAMRRSESDRWS